MRIIHFLLFILPCMLYLAGARKVQRYYSNFKLEKRPVYGKEHLIKDYVTLADDPKANIPDTFTICTSIHIKYRPGLKDVGIFEMLKEDGSHWFLLNYYVKSLEFFYMNPTTGKSGHESLSDTVIPIIPHSWYHACMGLDTVSGLLRIVVNGIQVVNEEKEYFKNTNKWKPRSLKGKILQFKGYLSGFWWQFRDTFSNMNIFSSMMSVEDMVTRTSGGDTCDTPGDYLRYKLYREFSVYCIKLQLGFG